MVMNYTAAWRLLIDCCYSDENAQRFIDWCKSEGWGDKPLPENNPERMIEIIKKLMTFLEVSELEQELAIAFLEHHQVAHNV